MDENKTFNTVADGTEMAVCPPEEAMAHMPEPEEVNEALPKKKVRKPKTKKTPAKPTKDQIIAQLKAENDHLKEIIESKDFAVKQITQRMDDLCKRYTDKTEYAMDMLTTCFKSIYREFKGER